jgi:hypothetical protein
VLEDTNHDGKMDKKTVFLDKPVLPRAMKVSVHGVLVGSPAHSGWRATQRGPEGGHERLICDCYGREMPTSSTTERTRLGSTIGCIP